MKYVRSGASTKGKKVAVTVTVTQKCRAERFRTPNYRDNNSHSAIRQGCRAAKFATQNYVMQAYFFCSKSVLLLTQPRHTTRTTEHEHTGVL